jgi:hypothetical protein
MGVVVVGPSGQSVVVGSLQMASHFTFNNPPQLPHGPDGGGVWVQLYSPLHPPLQV